MRRVYAIADEDLDRENDEKTSAVHFLRFELTPPMIAAMHAAARSRSASITRCIPLSLTMWTPPSGSRWLMTCSTDARRRTRAGSPWTSQRLSSHASSPVLPALPGRLMKTTPTLRKNATGTCSGAAGHAQIRKPAGVPGKCG